MADLCSDAIHLAAFQHFGCNADDLESNHHQQTFGQFTNIGKIIVGRWTAYEFGFDFKTTETGILNGLITKQEFKLSGTIFWGRDHKIGAFIVIAETAI